MKQPKTYTIKLTRGTSETTETGTLPELIEYFSYMLECGKCYDHERGNKKIDLVPKTIKSLVTNLNNAAKNAAVNGNSDRYYELV